MKEDPSAEDSPRKARAEPLAQSISSVLAAEHERFVLPVGVPARTQRDLAFSDTLPIQTQGEPATVR